MKCSNCGNKVKKSFKLCPICGSPIKEKKKEKKKLNIKLIIILFIALLIIITGVLVLLLPKKQSIDKIRKSVVKIIVYNSSGEEISTGSGFIVFKNDILVTNAHVITSGSKVEAITEDDERLYIDGAQYYSQDEDIAILKLKNNKKLKPLKINEDYKIGEKVIAIGSPLGIKNSVSDGILSNILKDENEKIQHTAPISPGNSGGALFNKKGEVIGMNTATITNAQNLNLAIPISVIKKAYKQSKNNKIIDVYKIQMNNDEKIQSIMLNNKVGKEIIDKTKKITNNKLNVRNKIKDLKDLLYLDKIYNNYRKYLDDILIVWGSDEYICKNCDKVWNPATSSWEEEESCECIDKENRILQKEAKMYEFVLIKSNYMDEIYINIENILESREGLAVSLINNNNPDYIYSNSYIQAINNATIGYYGKYAYMIISKDEDYKTEIVNLIKKLP